MGGQQGDPRGGPAAYGYREPRYAQPRNMIGLLGNLMAGKRDTTAFQEGRERYIEMNARRLESYGTEESMSLAKMFRQQPMETIRYFDDRGGIGEYEDRLRTEARQKKMTELLAVIPEGATQDEVAQAIMGFTGAKAERAFDISKSLYEARKGPDPYEPKDALSKVIQDREMLRTSDIWSPELDSLYKERIKKIAIRSGEEIVWNKDGSVTLRRGFGPGGVTDPTRTTQSRLQEEFHNTTTQISRMRGIQDTFEPGYYTSQYKAWGSWQEAKEKHLGGELGEEDEALLTQMWSHERRAWEHHNLTLKEMSGVAVNPQEAERIKRMMIDPGEHWWKGDGPTRARVKLADALVTTHRAKARAVYAMKHPGATALAKTDRGYKYTIGLDEIHDRIADFALKEWKRIESQNPGMDPKRVQMMVDSATIDEWGVTWKDVKDPDYGRAR